MTPTAGQRLKTGDFTTLRPFFAPSDLRFFSAKGILSDDDDDAGLRSFSLDAAPACARRQGSCRAIGAPVLGLASPWVPNSVPFVVHSTPPYGLAPSDPSKLCSREAKVLRKGDGFLTFTA